MKKIALLLLTTYMSSMQLSAHSNFFFNSYGGSVNFWSSIYMQMPTNLLDMLVNMKDPRGLGGSIRGEVFNLKADGAKVKIDKGNYWGFKKKDMFSNFQYGLKFGWQPELSPFGIFLTCAYQHRQFKVLLNPEVDGWSKFKLNYVRPGIGIRITPCISLLKYNGWSPIIEIGTGYNYNFKCSAPNENPKDQFENGMTTSFGAGVRFYNVSISGGAEIDNYNLFNKDFTPDGGITYPYKNINSKHITIFVSVFKDF